MVGIYAIFRIPSQKPTCVSEYEVPIAYSLDLFGIRVYPFAQGERRLTTFFPAPLEGTETKYDVWSGSRR
jgi:hypothetical protein